MPQRSYPPATPYDPRIHGDPGEFQTRVRRAPEQGVNMAIDPKTGVISRVDEPHRYAVYRLGKNKVTQRDAPQLDPIHGMQVAKRDDNGDLIPKKGAAGEQYEIETKKVPHAEAVEGQTTWKDPKGKDVTRYDGQRLAETMYPGRAAELAEGLADELGERMAVVDLVRECVIKVTAA